jgi:hypothetical protein
MRLPGATAAEANLQARSAACVTYSHCHNSIHPRCISRVTCSHSHNPSAQIRRVTLAATGNNLPKNQSAQLNSARMLQRIHVLLDGCGGRYWYCMYISIFRQWTASRAQVDVEATGASRRRCLDAGTGTFVSEKLRQWRLGSRPMPISTSWLRTKTVNDSRMPARKP